MRAGSLPIQRPSNRPSHRNSSRRERGSSLAFLAICGVGLAAASLMAADAGMMYYERTRMQAASDAAALAGAGGLARNQARARKDAQELARVNGYALAAEDVSFPSDRRCRVQLRSRKPMMLGRLLGLPDPDIMAESTAEVEVMSSGPGPRPFGVPDTDLVLGHCINGEREFVLKTGAGRSQRGNFQALAIDGPGAQDYYDAILHGSKRAIHVGDVVDTKPGNMTGPTVQAINRLIAGDYTRYEDARKAPEKTRRVIAIPLISHRSMDDARGRSPVRITGIAYFYITYATRKGEVYGRFIGNADEKAVGGTNQYAVRLVD